MEIPVFSFRNSEFSGRIRKRHGGNTIILDYGTITIVIILYQFIAAVVLVAMWSHLRHRVKGLGYWAANLWCQVGAQLVLLRLQTLGIAPHLPFLFLAGLGAIFFLFGFASLDNLPIRRRRYWLLYGVTVASGIGMTFAHLPDSYLRTLFNLFCAIVAVCYIVRMANGKKKLPWFGKTYSVMTSLYVAFGLYHLGWFLHSLAFPTLPFQVSCAGCIGQIVSMTLLTGINYCCIILVFNQLLHELEENRDRQQALLGQLKILAEQDGMTGIYNRMTIENLLDEQLARSQDGSVHLMILADVDSFKSINDRKGHECGDSVLIGLAGLFREAVEGTGFAGRWGGDEFMLIYPDIGKRKAVATIGTLQDRVRSQEWKSEGSLGMVSISCGYAIFDGQAEKRELLRRVDDSLYQAKKLGGNCWVGL
jgi:diguanylate cyclase (GGDEF)-like protein